MPSTKQLVLRMSPGDDAQYPFSISIPSLANIPGAIRVYRSVVQKMLLFCLYARWEARWSGRFSLLLILMKKMLVLG